MVDVTSMAGVVAAAAAGGTARVGAGARLIDVYNTLGHAGQLVPGGSCPTVGIAGLTLGGGVGVFARRYGLASRQRGRPHRRHGRRRRPPLLAARENASLYWACRGGGGGNFGVATSFELTTHPMPAVTLFTYDFDWAAAHDVLGAWQRWTAAVNDAVWSNCQLLSGAGTPSVRVAGVACATVAQTAAWLAPLFASVRPTYSFVGDEAYQRAMMIEAGCAGLTRRGVPPRQRTPPGVLSRQAFVASSSYVAAPMGDARLAAVVSVVDDLADRARPPSAAGSSSTRSAAGSTHVAADRDGVRPPRRSSPRSSRRSTGRRGRPSSQVRAGAAWLEHVRDAVYDAVDRRLPELHRPDAAATGPGAYYGENLARLGPVKRAVDPDDVFRFAQSIPPAAASRRRSAGRRRAGARTWAAAAASPGPVAGHEALEHRAAVRLVDVAAVLELRRHVVDVQHEPADRREPPAVRRRRGRRRRRSGWRAPSWRRSSARERVGVLDDVHGRLRAGRPRSRWWGSRGAGPRRRSPSTTTARTPSRRRPRAPRRAARRARRARGFAAATWQRTSSPSSTNWVGTTTATGPVAARPPRGGRSPARRRTSRHSLVVERSVDAPARAPRPSWHAAPRGQAAMASGPSMVRSTPTTARTSTQNSARQLDRALLGADRAGAGRARSPGCSASTPFRLPTNDSVTTPSGSRILSTSSPGSSRGVATEIDDQLRRLLAGVEPPRRRRRPRRARAARRSRGRASRSTAPRSRRPGPRA